MHRFVDHRSVDYRSVDYSVTSMVDRLAALSDRSLRRNGHRHVHRSVDYNRSVDYVSAAVVDDLAGLGEGGLRCQGHAVEHLRLIGVVVPRSGSHASHESGEDDLKIKVK